MFKRIRLAVAGLVALAASVPAHAVITGTDLEDIGAEITGTVAVLFPWALGMVAVVLGATIALGLVKKFGRKAGS